MEKDLKHNIMGNFTAHECFSSKLKSKNDLTLENRKYRLRIENIVKLIKTTAVFNSHHIKTFSIQPPSQPVGKYSILATILKV